MSMAIAATDHEHWTAADLREVADDRNRYEIIGGELFVTPSPSWGHQRLAKQLLLGIDPYLDAHRIGTLVMAPGDVALADDTVVQPDLFVVPLVSGKPPQRWEDVRRLLLVVKILSPGTARVDRTVKRRRYQLEGVPEYWIVDAESRLVERWQPTDDRPEILAEQIQWHPDPTQTPLVIDLSALFAATLDP